MLYDSELKETNEGTSDRKNSHPSIHPPKHKYVSLAHSETNIEKSEIGRVNMVIMISLGKSTNHKESMTRILSPFSLVA